MINIVTVMFAPFDRPHEEQHAGLNILFFSAVVLPRCTVLKFPVRVGEPT
jgi:hypothetical protein